MRKHGAPAPAMSSPALVAACKQGLRLSETTTAFDDLLDLKIAVVETYMRGAGVSDAVMASDAASGTIVLGVIDIFGVTPGETKFSPVFLTLVSQLAAMPAADSGGAA